MTLKEIYERMDKLNKENPYASEEGLAMLLTVKEVKSLIRNIRKDAPKTIKK